jgi:hypothetical protein
VHQHGYLRQLDHRRRSLAHQRRSKPNKQSPFGPIIHQQPPGHKRSIPAILPTAANISTNPLLPRDHSITNLAIL